MENKNRAFWGILLVTMFFFVILVVFSLYTVKLFKTEYEEQLTGASFGEKAIAVIEINGIILKAKKTIQLLNMAEKSKNIEAIIVRINSPGGAVGPSQEIYEEMRRIDTTDIKDGGKPIYASMGSIAASGGYYIASAARTIFANKGTLTGSIGVIMEFMDMSKLYQFAKISPEIIKAGKYKDAGNPARKLTNEERALMSGMIERVHQQFVDDILLVRKDKIVGDIQELAQGQIFSGEDAKKFGLVDEIGGLWATGRFISRSLGHKNDLEFRFIKKKSKSGIWKLLDNLDEASSFFKKFESRMNSYPTLMYK